MDTSPAPIQGCFVQGGGIVFHNPSFQAPTRLLEGEECAGENIPTAVKRHSFLCPFPDWPFLLIGSTRWSLPRVTSPCHPGVPLPSCVQIIAVGISRLLDEETPCFSLMVLLGQSSDRALYLDNKSPGSPEHTLHARH